MLAELSKYIHLRSPEIKGVAAAALWKIEYIGDLSTSNERDITLEDLKHY